MKFIIAAVVTVLGTTAVAQPLAAHAAEVVVRVSLTGAKTTNGEVGCSLFSAPKGFPLDISAARSQWQPAAKEITCRFSDVADGTYAVAVGQDLNGNRLVDTNPFGAPTEPWGVSNNIRHRFTAPKFDEAAFRVAGGRDVQLEVRAEP